MPSDPEMDKIASDRAHDLAGLFGLDPAESDMPLPTPLPSQQPPLSLEALANIQLPPTASAPQPQAAAYQAQPSVPAESDNEETYLEEERPYSPRPFRPRPQWFRFLKRCWEYEETRLYLGLFFMGLIGRANASSYLPSWGLKLLDWGSFGAIGCGVIFAFMEREFFLVLAFGLGVLIAQRFL